MHTILPAILAHSEQEFLDKLALFDGIAPVIHVDVMDGSFVPNTTWFDVIALHTKRFQSRFELHLMVNDPRPLGTLFAKIGCIRILPHIETFNGVDDAKTMFAEWKAAGASEVGISLLLDTPLSEIDQYADMIDVVQLMSIAKVGAQGQPFDESIYSRIEELHATYPDMMVSVDGGVAENNVEMLTRAGANRLCVGSAISKAEDPAAAYAAIHARAMKGCAPVTIEMGM
jgi:ribulose-phosphate 3-epimerase